jgi:hypothetical protein
LLEWLGTLCLLGPPEWLEWLGSRVVSGACFGSVRGLWWERCVGLRYFDAHTQKRVGMSDG